MEMNDKHSERELLQDAQLDHYRNNQSECTVITTNGVQMRGRIESYDKYVILLRTHAGKQSLIYKHAVSTIIGDYMK
ncbi:RNA-binding protein Hfq [compost metagenome]